MIVCACLPLLTTLSWAQRAGATSLEWFVDFDASVDGEGTISSPWNTLVGKPVDGADQVTIWLQGEANPAKIPISLHATSAGTEKLRLLSRHLVDPSAPRAHFSRSYRVAQDLGFESVGGGVYRAVLPPRAEYPAAVLRGWTIPAHRPIPPEGLKPGLAFDQAYTSSFRINEEARVALPREFSLGALSNRPYGWFSIGYEVYIKTPSGNPPGTRGEPEYRVAVATDDRLSFISINTFGNRTIRDIEVAGWIVSLHVGYYNKRALQFYPGDTVTVRDMLFVACTDNDNIAVVNGGGPGTVVRGIRNQHIGVGEDGGPFVVATLNDSTPYERFIIEDQVTHPGYRLYTLGGTDAGLARVTRFSLGAFHQSDVNGGGVHRAISLAYNNPQLALGQFPVKRDLLAGADVRDPASFPFVLSDIYAEGLRNMNDFNLRGVRVERSTLRSTERVIVSLFNDISFSHWESCLFELGPRFNALGNIGADDAAFVNCTVRVIGDSRAALFGVGEESTGRVFVRDLVVERADPVAGFRFANARAGHGPPALKPGAIVGWEGTPDLGSIWFANGTIDSGASGLQTPELGGPADGLDMFRAVHGDRVRLGPTGTDGIPVMTPPTSLAADVAAGNLARPLSAAITGPTGLNGAGFSGRLGAFQSGHPDACSVADRAPPYGTLTFADLGAFLAAFASGDPGVDAEEPEGLTFADVTRFLAVYAAGCP